VVIPAALAAVEAAEVEVEGDVVVVDDFTAPVGGTASTRNPARAD